jgi:hypothetical protein
MDIEKEFIIKDMIFGKISDIRPSFEVVDEFIHEFLYKEQNKSILINDLSNLYILSAFLGSESCLNKTEMKWCDILNDTQNDILKKNGEYIIGYMLIDDSYDGNIHYIELINTRVRNHNFAKIMMNKYTDLYDNKYDDSHDNKYLVPKDIIYSSKNYWEKIFQDMFLVYTSRDLEEFIDEYKINKKIINYDYLCEVLDEKEIIDNDCSNSCDDSDSNEIL